MHIRAAGRSGPVAPRASRVVVVLAWALAVLVAGAVTSWAVGVISNEQGPARDRVLAESQVTTELAAARALAGTALPAPPPPAAVPAIEPTETPSARSATAAPPVAPPVDSAEVARTWDVAGGQVGASCRGSVLRLLYATPLDGWTVEVKHAGSDELEVAFRQDRAETTVRASCVSGVPTQGTDQD